MPKPYHELIPGRIYIGGADDIQQIADEEHIDLVIDLREESTACAATAADLQWCKIPLGDQAGSEQLKLIDDAIQAVVTAYRNDRKLAFHCGGGKGRTGTVAAGVLLELGLCSDVDEAIAMARSIRPVISLKPDQRAALEALYPTA